jgi:hypothetical protein
MGQVDQHAQPVHLPHDLASKLGESVVTGGVERGIGPVESDVVGERHVPRTEIVIGSEGAQRVFDGVPALHAQQRPHAPTLEAAFDIIRRQCQLQPVRVTRNDTARDVELLQLHLGEAAVLDLAREIDGPELSTHKPFLQPVEISVAFRGFAQVVPRHIPRRILALPDRPGKIVVPVYERRRAQELLGPLQSTIRLAGCRGGHSGH